MAADEGLRVPASELMADIAVLEVAFVHSVLLENTRSGVVPGN